MPAVDCEQAATRDGDGGRYAEVGERVGGDVCHRRVGGEFEHHDDILLHLILKHQRALGKETLVRQKERGEGNGHTGENGVDRWKRGGQGEGEVSYGVEPGEHTKDGSRSSGKACRGLRFGLTWMFLETLRPPAAERVEEDYRQGG